MDPVVIARDPGKLTTTKRLADAMNKNQKDPVQKGNILPLILPPDQLSVIALRILLLILKMGHVLKSLLEALVQKERY